MRFITLALWMFMQCSVFSAGVIAYKARDYHPDSSASIALYRYLKEPSSGPITVTTHDKVFVIERSQFVSKVEIIETLPAKIIEEADISYIRKRLQEYRDFVSRFERSKSLLEGFIEDLQSVISAFDNGRVRFKSEWMNKEKMLGLKQVEEDQIKAEKERSEITAREKAAFEESQKAKGLALLDGKWITVEEFQVLSQKRQNEIEQSRKLNDANKLLGKKAVFRRFKIIQVLNDGLLVECPLILTPVTVFGPSNGIQGNGDGGTFYVNRGGNTLWFITNFYKKDLVDGDKNEGWFVDIGTYKYTSVLGALTTIQKLQYVEEKYVPERSLREYKKYTGMEY